MLKELIETRRIKFLLVCFADVAGAMRSKLVPASAIDTLLRQGAAFAGSATHLGLQPSDPDLIVWPDAKSFTVLPWNPEVAWVTGDLFLRGEPLPQSPRNTLKRLVAMASARNWALHTGVEPEFYLLARHGMDIADELDQDPKPCYGQAALMRRYDFIKSVSETLQALEWEPYQNDHEDAPGQFEVNWRFSHALETADRHLFFKFLVKTLAEQSGMRASFMPKPFSGRTGNGCHIHCSIWDPKGTANLFTDPGGDLGLSPLAYRFVAGLLRHAGALSALCNPTVNSYKRLHAGWNQSGTTYAPVAPTYGGNNRSHMVRIPGGDRIELRLPDGAANPYLLQSAALAAGYLGMAGGEHPGPRRDDNAYAEAPAPRCAGPRLPGTLAEALADLERDEAFRSLMGADLVRCFLRNRQQEVAEDRRQVSPWEQKVTVDC